MQKSNIKVTVRIRPPLEREIKSGEFYNCIAVGKKTDSEIQKVYVSLNEKPVILREESENKALDGIAIYTFNNIFDINSTQGEIYENIGKPCVRSVINGINSTIFAYGQTGTGKTYTMFGDEKELLNPEKSGLATKAVFDLFENLQNLGNNEKKMEIEEKKMDEFEDFSDTDTHISDIEQNTTVFVSILQIYNENVTDLLQKDQVFLKTKLDSQKKYYVENLTQIEARTPEQVIKLVKKGYQNRISHSTNMNETSSRSHMILTLTVNTVDRDGTLTSAKLNIVDLAGSEKLKDSKSQGQQLKEACHINLSLFHLAGVVHALEKGQTNINYRDSKLTLLLQDSIGGNCQTTMLACLSPSKDFCKESNSTLTFAHSCKQIQNIIKPNKYRNIIPASTPIKKKAEVSIPWENTKLEIISQFVKFHDEKIHILRTGDPSWEKSVIFIHGCSAKESTALQFQHLFPAFLYIKHQVFALDMPGYGKSSGKIQSFRTLDILLPGGPASVIKSLIQSFNLKNPVLMGYDWGGSICLRLGVENPENFSQIIAFMPAYGEKQQNMDELKKLKTPTLVQWVKQDQMHNYKKEQKIMEKIPKVKLDLIEMNLWKPEFAANIYQKISHRMTTEIVKFITGIDVSQQQQKVLKAQKEECKSVNNQNIMAIQQISFLDQLSEQQMQNMAKMPSLSEANDFFKKKFGTNLIEIIEKNKNNTLPISMQQKNYVNLLSEVAQNAISDQEVQLNFNILKQSLVEPAFNKVDKNSIPQDEDYYDSFKKSENIKEIFISTDFGKVHAFTSVENFQNVIIAMHGDGIGRNHEKWLSIVEILAKKGYQLFALSMPGYGKTTGSQSSFRQHGSTVLNQVLETLNLKKAVIMGRSVGGRTAIEFANQFAEKCQAVILQHPVVPNDGMVSSMRQPILLSWAKDDGTWDNWFGHATAGHPYFGPHGANYIKKLTGCEMNSWNESDYVGGPREYYQTTFVEKVVGFLRKNNIC